MTKSRGLGELAGLLIAVAGCSGAQAESVEVSVPGLEEPMYVIAGAEASATLGAESGGSAAELEKGLNLVKAGEYGAALPVFAGLAETQPELPLLNNLGVLQAATGSPAAARDTFLQAIGLDAEHPVVLMNHGLLKLSGGQVAEAMTTLAKVEFQPAKRAIRRLRQRVEAGTLEIEPNDDPSRPNEAALDTWIDGAIGDPSDADAFRFTTPARSRDWLKIELDNRTDSLKPRLVVYYENEQLLGGTAEHSFQVTPGQDQAYSFVCSPDTVYYVVVRGLGGTGAYRVRVAPQQAYDAYEPNEERLQAADLPIGERVEAGIMDGGDQDFYKIRALGGTETVELGLVNRSSALKPRLGVYSANKQWLGGTAEHGFQVTAGQDMSYSFQTEGGAEYFVWVQGLAGTAGDYVLSITEE